MPADRRAIEEWLGERASHLLDFKHPKIPKERLHLHGPEIVDRVYGASDRNNRVLASLQAWVIRSGRSALKSLMMLVECCRAVMMSRQFPSGVFVRHAPRSAERHSLLPSSVF